MEPVTLVQIMNEGVHLSFWANSLEMSVVIYIYIYICEWVCVFISVCLGIYLTPSIEQDFTQGHFHAAFNHLEWRFLSYPGPVAITNLNIPVYPTINP